VSLRNSWVNPPDVHEPGRVAAILGGVAAAYGQRINGNSFNFANDMVWARMRLWACGALGCLAGGAAVAAEFSGVDQRASGPIDSRRRYDVVNVGASDVRFHYAPGYYYTLSPGEIRNVGMLRDNSSGGWSGLSPTSGPVQGSVPAFGISRTFSVGHSAGTNEFTVFLNCPAAQGEITYQSGNSSWVVWEYPDHIVIRVDESGFVSLEDSALPHKELRRWMVRNDTGEIQTLEIDGRAVEFEPGWNALNLNLLLSSDGDVISLPSGLTGVNFVEVGGEQVGVSRLGFVDFGDGMSGLGLDSMGGTLEAVGSGAIKISRGDGSSDLVGLPARGSVPDSVDLSGAASVLSNGEVRTAAAGGSLPSGNGGSSGGGGASGGGSSSGSVGGAGVQSTVDAGEGVFSAPSMGGERAAARDEASGATAQGDEALEAAKGWEVRKFWNDEMPSSSRDLAWMHQTFDFGNGLAFTLDPPESMVVFVRAMMLVALKIAFVWEVLQLFMR